MSRLLHLRLAVRMPLLFAVGACLLLAACGGMPRPMAGLDRALTAAGPSRDPVLAGRWLALIAERGGRDQVQLIDVERGLPVPLPGLNRPDAQPVSVGLNAAGDRLAMVRRLEGRTELVLYRRSFQSLEPIPMQPPGVPGRVSLQADGRQLAVEVSRGGVWQVDLITVR
jgi:hypothetical protein